jgi:hypothetical protein
MDFAKLNCTSTDIYGIKLNVLYTENTVQYEYMEQSHGKCNISANSRPKSKIFQIVNQEPDGFFRPNI